jgi:hypothetical protein
MPALALHSFSKAIEIPAGVRDQPLVACQPSARLGAMLERFGIHVLGDLHGRKVVDFAWERNCGPKTLYELDLLTRRARFSNGNGSRSNHQRDYADALHTPSHNFAATGRELVTGNMQEDGGRLAIPESVCHLPFNELPITRRLANVLRAIGARNLGDLNGRSAFELLQYKACGWGRISEIQQLVERAVSGEFDVGQIQETTATIELLNLLEQGIAKLPLRDRQFVLARIGAETVNRGADLLSPSYAEIGRRYGLTRARVHKVFANTVNSLRKIWGPRVPRLLEATKWRCVSMVCPLTPQLLKKWVEPSAASSPRLMRRASVGSVQLPMEAHVRLIAALDRNIPCWPTMNHKAPPIDGSVCQFDLALAHLVRATGGRISVAEAFRKISLPAGRDYRRLTVQSFLSMLRNGECTVVEFKNPERPIVRLNPKLRIFPGGIATQNGKPPTGRKIHSNSPAIRLFEPGTSFCERDAAVRR